MEVLGTGVRLTLHTPPLPKSDGSWVADGIVGL